MTASKGVRHTLFFVNTGVAAAYFDFFQKSGALKMGNGGVKGAILEN